MPTELWFHEQLNGAFALGVSDPRAGEASGEKAKTTFGFDLTVYVADLDAFIADPMHTATVSGKYLGNLFPSVPVLQSGTFNFMSPGAGSSRHMEHHHVFTTGGKTYAFYGEKDILNDPLALDEIHDVTTLYSTIRDDTKAIVGAGVLHFPMRDFADLVSSFHVRGTKHEFAAKMKFLKFFLHEEVYVLLANFERQPAPPNRRRTLARPHAELEAAYDVVVIGSGYGGGTAAARLAAEYAPGKKKKVCVLERGKEWRAGDFPDEPGQLVANLRTPLNPGGLFEFHWGSDMDAVVGNGLGGTSLINANVMIKPESAILATHLPAGIPNLDPYYERARAMLMPTPDPALPLKAERLTEGAQSVPGAAPAKACDIAVTFEKTRYRADVDVTQIQCNGCGGCVTGCNFTAKNTVDMNYLAFAEREGARIFTSMEVRTLEKTPQGYTLHCHDHENGTDVDVDATQVVVSAGTMGSFAVLKRSAMAHGLAVSPTLGKGFSGNGDVIGLAYNDTDSTAVTNGPTITKVVEFYTAPDPKDHFIIEDGGIPRALVAAVRTALPILRHRDGTHPHGWVDRAKRWLRELADVVGLDSAGALSHSLLYLGMGFENGAGELEIVGDEVRVKWPNVGNQPWARRIDDAMFAITDRLGGVYVKNPEPRSFLTSNLITVHPLGGCVLGADANAGVVNAKGEVFGCPGLFVADGSIISGALGVNPAFTIAALTEWISEGIRSGW